MVLNGHYSNWPEIKAGVPQGPLFFLVYINDLPEGMTTNAKLLANDTSFFSVVHNFTSSSVSMVSIQFMFSETFASLFSLYIVNIFAPNLDLHMQSLT